MKTKIEFIKQNKLICPVITMGKILKVNRSSIYKFKKPKINNSKSFFLIKKIFNKHYGCYGYRRLKIAIEKETGWVINHKKLLKIMRQNNIKTTWVKYIHRKKSKRSYEQLSNGEYNLLQRNCTVESPNQKWVTDITYIKIPKENKFFYLSTIIDLL